jgi:hypothetical protein
MATISVTGTDYNTFKALITEFKKPTIIYRLETATSALVSSMGALEVGFVYNVNQEMGMPTEIQFLIDFPDAIKVSNLA